MNLSLSLSVYIYIYIKKIYTHTSINGALLNSKLEPSFGEAIDRESLIILCSIITHSELYHFQVNIREYLFYFVSYPSPLGLSYLFILTTPFSYLI